MAEYLEENHSPVASRVITDHLPALYPACTLSICIKSASPKFFQVKEFSCPICVYAKDIDSCSKLELRYQSTHFSFFPTPQVGSIVATNACISGQL